MYSVGGREVFHFCPQSIQDARIHRPLKVIEFDANGIWRQRYEISKQVQDLHTDVALLSETHLKPHERLSTVVYSAKARIFNNML
jgi:hypothetical protein